MFPYLLVGRYAVFKYYVEFTLINYFGGIIIYNHLASYPSEIHPFQTS